MSIKKLKVSNAQVAQQQNIRDIANHFMGGQGGRIRQPHLMLEVSRDNIVHDTVHQIEHIIYNESNGVGALRKPLLGMMFLPFKILDFVLQKFGLIVLLRYPTNAI